MHPHPSSSSRLMTCIVVLLLLVLTLIISGGSHAEDVPPSPSQQWTFIGPLPYNQTAAQARSPIVTIAPIYFTDQVWNVTDLATGEVITNASLMSPSAAVSIASLSVMRDWPPVPINDSGTNLDESNENDRGSLHDGDLSIVRWPQLNTSVTLLINSTRNITMGTLTTSATHIRFNRTLDKRITTSTALSMTIMDRWTIMSNSSLTDPSFTSVSASATPPAMLFVKNIVIVTGSNHSSINNSTVPTNSSSVANQTTSSGVVTLNLHSIAIGLPPLSSPNDNVTISSQINPNSTVGGAEIHLRGVNRFLAPVMIFGDQTQLIVTAGTILSTTTPLQATSIVVRNACIVTISRQLTASSVIIEPGTQFNVPKILLQPSSANSSSRAILRLDPSSIMLQTQSIDANTDADIQLLSERELVPDGLTINLNGGGNGGGNSTFTGYLYTRSAVIQGATNLVIARTSTISVGLTTQRGSPTFGPTFSVVTFTVESASVIGVRDASLTSEAYILVQPIDMSPVSFSRPLVYLREASIQTSLDITGTCVIAPSLSYSSIGAATTTLGSGRLSLSTCLAQPSRPSCSYIIDPGATLMALSLVTGCSTAPSILQSATSLILRNTSRLASSCLRLSQIITLDLHPNSVFQGALVFMSCVSTIKLPNVMSLQVQRITISPTSTCSTYLEIDETLQPNGQPSRPPLVVISSEYSNVATLHLERLNRPVTLDALPVTVNWQIGVQSFPVYLNIASSPMRLSGSLLFLWGSTLAIRSTQFHMVNGTLTMTQVTISGNSGLWAEESANASATLVSYSSTTAYYGSILLDGYQISVHARLSFDNYASMTTTTALSLGDISGRWSSITPQYYVPTTASVNFASGRIWVTSGRTWIVSGLRVLFQGTAGLSIGSGATVIFTDFAKLDLQSTLAITCQPGARLIFGRGAVFSVFNTVTSSRQILLDAGCALNTTTDISINVPTQVNGDGVITTSVPYSSSTTSSGIVIGDRVIGASMALSQGATITFNTPRLAVYSSLQLLTPSTPITRERAYLQACTYASFSNSAPGVPLQWQQSAWDDWTSAYRPCLTSTRQYFVPTVTFALGLTTELMAYSPIAVTFSGAGNLWGLIANRAPYAANQLPTLTIATQMTISGTLVLEGWMYTQTAPSSRGSFYMNAYSRLTLNGTFLTMTGGSWSFGSSTVITLLRKSQFTITSSINSYQGSSVIKLDPDTVFTLQSGLIQHTVTGCGTFASALSYSTLSITGELFGSSATCPLTIQCGAATSTYYYTGLSSNTFFNGILFVMARAVVELYSMSFQSIVIKASSGANQITLKSTNTWTDVVYEATSSHVLNFYSSSTTTWNNVTCIWSYSTSLSYSYGMNWKMNNVRLLLTYPSLYTTIPSGTTMTIGDSFYSQLSYTFTGALVVGGNTRAYMKSLSLNYGAVVNFMLSAQSTSNTTLRVDYLNVNSGVDVTLKINPFDDNNGGLPTIYVDGGVSPFIGGSWSIYLTAPSGTSATSDDIPDRDYVLVQACSTCYVDWSSYSYNYFPRGGIVTVGNRLVYRPGAVPVPPRPMTAGEIAGIIIGCVSFVALSCGLWYCFCRSRAQRANEGGFTLIDPYKC